MLMQTKNSCYSFVYLGSVELNNLIIGTRARDYGNGAKMTNCPIKNMSAEYMYCVDHIICGEMLCRREEEKFNSEGTIVKLHSTNLLYNMSPRKFSDTPFEVIRTTGYLLDMNNSRAEGAKNLFVVQGTAESDDGFLSCLREEAWYYDT